LATLAISLATAGLLAQAPPRPTPVFTENSTGSGPLDRLYFRSIGPATPSGRVDDLAVLESDPTTFYIGMATAGVYKTTNAGTTFTNVFDHEGSSSVGAVAIAPTDANLVWVGTGEPNNRQSSSWGDGVYKSTDGGRTWANKGLRDTKQIARIIVDPSDFNVVYVAAPGNLWGPGGERGVYKTTDGGATWTRVLHVDDDTGATDMVMDPVNPNTLYAATYQRRRAQWGMNGGGPGSGIWKSTDAGRTWAKIEAGIPAGPKGRIGLAIYRANPNVLYATVEHPEQSGVYRTDNAGAAWRKLSDTNPRPMYFSKIRIDPQSDSRIYVLGVSLMVSDDGGRTFRGDGAERIHVDHHAMWINPRDPRHIIIGNDGGVSVSHDRSGTWAWYPNLLASQAYHVEFDMQTPYHVCAGLQDNNTWCGPSAVRTNSGIHNDNWYVISGGDGFQPLMDPTDARIVYAESQDGRMSRTDRLTNERQTVRPEPAELKPGDTTGQYRFNWDTAMQLSPFDPATIYIGANMVLKSSDRGRSYQPISPDLTTNTDRETLSIMGVVGKDVRIAKNDGVGSFGNIVTLEESSARQGVVWVGSDDGVVSVTQDAGKTWTNVTSKIPGVPKWTYVSDVLPSRAQAGTAYVAFDGHRGGDFNTYVFTTTDFGATWRSIVSNLPKGEVARGLAEDRRDPNILYLGTETGLWVSWNKGAQWTRLKANLPTMPIYEIKQHPRDNDLILASHARGIWILDDMSPIQEWAKSEAADAFLFSSEPATIMNQANDQMKGFEGDRLFLGLNPAPGATLAYRLKSDAKEVKLTIKDAGGATVREISGNDVRDRNKAGLNIVKWDLRVQPLRPLPPPPGAAAGAGGAGGGGGFGGGGNNGPYVLPGTYRATLSVNGRDAQTIDVAVKGDPDIRITDADRRAWFETARDLHDLQQKANDVAEMVQNAFAQVQTLQQQSRGANLSGNAKQQLDAVVKEFEAVRRRLGLGQQGGGGGFGGNTENLRGRFGQMKGQIMGATALPTNTQMMQIREMRAALPGLIDQANAAAAKVPGLVKELIGNGAIFPAIKPVPKG
ncbi:MAG TPA: hypothetical protein VNT81_02105, partial [Vicinamibacterales bacterium]|nr:hypothetical protein [Vicinamibacterales bacterium]